MCASTTSIAFLDKTCSQLTIGEIPPIQRAALAAVAKKVRVALICGEKETTTALLRRLDTALGKAISENAVIDEVLPEIQHCR